MKQKNYIFKLLLKIWLSTYFIYMFCLMCMGMIVDETGDKLYIIIIILPTSLSGISTTGFLNCFATIRNNSLYSFLSFFLLPILLMEYGYTKPALNFYAILFMVILFGLYVIFRRKIRKYS